MILSPLLALGSPENFRGLGAIPPSLGPLRREVEAANSDLVPALSIGEPRECKG